MKGFMVWRSASGAQGGAQKIPDLEAFLAPDVQIKTA